MKNKELINLIKYNELLSPEVCEEIIQKLLEFDELKKVIHDTVDPLIELTAYLLGVSDFQGGDITYGRE